MNKRKLGRGLGDIFDGDLLGTIDEIESHATITGKVMQVPLDQIRPNPYQPRTEFVDKKIDELSESIKEFGVFSPILLRKAIKGYEIVAGERRTRASRRAGLKEIPAILVDYEQEKMMEVALIENIQREQLNPLEEAIAYQRILTHNNFTQGELAKRVGKSRSHISNSIRITELSEYVRKHIALGNLSMGHIKPLLSLKPESAEHVAKYAIEEKWTVRKVEEFVANLKISKPKKTKQIKNKPSAVSAVEQMISHKLGTKVEINNNVIKIKYTNNNDLNRLLDIMDIRHE